MICGTCWFNAEGACRLFGLPFDPQGTACQYHSYTEPITCMYCKKPIILNAIIGEKGFMCERCRILTRHENFSRET